MRLAVLGSAAGGGFPQWNSGSTACHRARAGDPAALPRTQTGLAVSGDGKRWFLINASPDLPAQIRASPFLRPSQGPRGSPIAGVVLTGAEVDVIAGLLSLREGHAFTLYATSVVLGVLGANPIFDVLAGDRVRRRAVTLDEPLALGDDLTLDLFAVPGKTPLFLEGRPDAASEGFAVGLKVRSGRSAFVFVPSCARITADLAARLAGADAVLFDGTFWSEDEMVRLGLSQKTASRMGHLPLDGPCGVLAAFEGLDVGRKILIHVNNSNPVLLADSPERAEVERRGWEVAVDGMGISL